MSFIPFNPDQYPTPEAEPPRAAMLSDVLATLPAERGTAGPLTNFQKWQLSQMAAVVHAVLREAGGCVGESVEKFRQRVAIEACGKRISGASQGDYKLIQAALLKLKGDEEGAGKARAKAALLPVEIARHKLWSLAADLKFSPAYVEGIAWRFYKMRVADLKDAKAVWSVFYTVQNNGNQRDGKGQKANRFKSRRAKA